MINKLENENNLQLASPLIWINFPTPFHVVYNIHFLKYTISLSLGVVAAAFYGKAWHDTAWGQLYSSWE